MPRQRLVVTSNDKGRARAAAFCRTIDGQKREAGKHRGVSLEVGIEVRLQVSTRIEPDTGKQVCQYRCRRNWGPFIWKRVDRVYCFDRPAVCNPERFELIVVSWPGGWDIKLNGVVRLGGILSKSSVDMTGFVDTLGICKHDTYSERGNGDNT